MVPLTSSRFYPLQSIGDRVQAACFNTTNSTTYRIWFQVNKMSLNVIRITVTRTRRANDYMFTICTSNRLLFYWLDCISTILIKIIWICSQFFENQQIQAESFFSLCHSFGPERQKIQWLWRRLLLRHLLPLQLFLAVTAATLSALTLKLDLPLLTFLLIELHTKT